MGKYIQRIVCEFDSKEIVQRVGCPVNFIAEMFEALIVLRKVEGLGISKISIVFSDNKSADMEYEDLVDVLVVECYLDLEAIEKMNKYEKKKSILDNILRCTEYLSKSRGWNPAPFHEAYEEILERNIKYEGQLIKVKASPSRKHKAWITFKYEYSIEAFLVLDNGELVVNFADLHTSFSGLKDIVNKIEWIDDNTIRICNKNQKDYWIYYLDENKLDFYFERAEKGDAHGQYDLGMMYLEGKFIFANKEKAIFWLRKSAEQNYKRAEVALSKIQD